jgi:hypothetical protein
LQAAQKQTYENRIKTIHRQNDIDLRVNHRSPEQLARFDVPSLTHRLLEDGVLERYAKYEQRLFNNMLRCMKELRAMKKEAVEDIDAQNEATAAPDAHVKNEATANAPVVQNEATANAAVVQNEATAPFDAAKFMQDLGLPGAMQQPVRPCDPRIASAVEQVLYPGASATARKPF